MGHRSSLIENDMLVVDTSVVINLNATGCAKEILVALPHGVIVVDVVLHELESGRSKGRRDAAMLEDLSKVGLVTISPLGQSALPCFENLVAGGSKETLDDGEAATIAHAIDRKACAVIDEAKAIKLCAMRFPQVNLSSTIDLLAHRQVQEALGLPALAVAVYQALVSARMRVLPSHLDWVLKLIGNERAAACHSLPARVREVGAARL